MEPQRTWARLEALASSKSQPIALTGSPRMGKLRRILVRISGSRVSPIFSSNCREASQKLRPQRCSMLKSRSPPTFKWEATAAPLWQDGGTAVLYRGHRLAKAT